MIRKSSVSVMKTLIPKFRDEFLDIKNVMGRWEFFKYKMRPLSMKYSKERAAEIKWKENIFGK